MFQEQDMRHLFFFISAGLFTRPTDARLQTELDQKLDKNNQQVMTDKSGQITMTTNPTQDATRMETLAAALVVFFCFMDKTQMIILGRNKTGTQQRRQTKQFWI